MTSILLLLMVALVLVFFFRLGFELGKYFERNKRRIMQSAAPQQGDSEG